MADCSFKLEVVKLLEDRLSGKTFICGEKMTESDAYALISKKPSSESYPKVSKWYDAVTKEVVSSFLENAGQKGIGGQAASVKAAAEAKVGETEEKEKAAEGREAAKASKSKRWKMFYGVFVRNGNEGAIEEKVGKMSEELPGVLVARTIWGGEDAGFKSLKIALLVVGDEFEDDAIFYDKVGKFLGLQFEANPAFHYMPCFVFDGSSMV